MSAASCDEMPKSIMISDDSDTEMPNVVAETSTTSSTSPLPTPKKKTETSDAEVLSSLKRSNSVKAKANLFQQMQKEKSTIAKPPTTVTENTQTPKKLRVPLPKPESESKKPLLNLPLSTGNSEDKIDKEIAATNFKEKLRYFDSLTSPVTPSPKIRIRVAISHGTALTPQTPQKQAHLQQPQRSPLQPRNDEQNDEKVGSENRKIGKIRVPLLFESRHNEINKSFSVSPMSQRTPTTIEKMLVDDDSGKENNCETSPLRKSITQLKQQLEMEKLNTGIKRQEPAKMQPLKTSKIPEKHHENVKYFNKIPITDELATADEVFKRIYKSYHRDGKLPDDIDALFEKLYL